jgi:hypothetical protein
MRGLPTAVAVALILGTTLAAPAAAATQKQANRVAQRIVEADALPDAVAATRTALARGGVGTKAGGRFVVRPAGKPAIVSVTDLESLNLAAEARERETAGRVTLAQYARMLDEARMPFRRGQSPGRQMVKLLAAWVRQARRHPSDPQSFTPLFLAAMAKHQEPPLNLAKPRYDASDLRLTLLETELVSAAFLRFDRPPRRAAARAAQADPSKACSDFKKYLEQNNPFLGRGHNFGVEYLAGKIFERIFGRAVVDGRGLTDEQVDDLRSKANAAATVLLRVQKLVAFYQSIQVQVAPRQPAVTASESGTIFEQFGVLVGFTPEALEEYRKELDKINPGSRDLQRLVRDCYAALGLPLVTDVGDLAGELDSYRVHWTFEQLRPRTATVNVAQTRANGFDFRTTRLERINDFEARALFVVDILPGRAGKRSTAIGACADLDSSQPPSIKTWVTAIERGVGIADPLSELAAGWLQAVATPSTCNIMDVHYVDAHSFDFALKGRQQSDWDYRFESAPNQCNAGSTFTSSGTQVLDFETPAPQRVTFRRVPGRGDWRVYFAVPPGSRPEEFDLAGDVNRNSTTSFTSQGTPCPQGGGGTPAPPDCGPRSVTFRAKLGLESDALVLESLPVQPNGQSDWGYRNCHGLGIYVRQLVKALRELDEGDIDDPDVGRFDVVGSARTTEDFNGTSPSGTETGTANHSLRWEAQFVRVDPPEE